ncbi:hypothetical protein ACIBEJ_02980 [Nonomuraea sp. NPDC050790]|uniref:hypothetical protein n=1 Tax=Nonomuraea sp. NPDC050790 TaxID=3364371 RepID=UPI0037B1AB84
MKDNEAFLRALEAEVEVELNASVASHPEEALELPVTEWLFDPMDAEREQVGLRGVLDAIEVLEHGERPGGDIA